MSQPIETLSAAQQIVAQTGIGLPAALNNYVMRDSAAVRAELGLGTARTVMGGTVSPFFGAIALTIPVTAGAEAFVGGSPAIMCNVSPTGFWSRRIICGFSLSPGTLPTGRIIVVQLGKDRTDTTHNVLNSAEKGIGFIVSPTAVTAYYANGSVSTNIFTAVNPLTYGRFIVDFVPGVKIDTYGVTPTSATPVLLGTSSVNLPTGNDLQTNGNQLQIGLFDNTGTIGSAAYTAYVNNVSISFP